MNPSASFSLPFLHHIFAHHNRTHLPGATTLDGPEDFFLSPGPRGSRMAVKDKQLPEQDCRGGGWVGEGAGCLPAFQALSCKMDY